MHIGGFQKLTLSDFSGKPACIVFTQGCNFRCPFCHNAGLLPKQSDDTSISEQEVFDYLHTRRHLLDGVVISGGEPCLQEGLRDFIERMKSLGLSVKLDTNGSRPDVLKQLLSTGLVDYVAMDVKAPQTKYDALTGCAAPVSDIKESIHHIIESGCAHEFRTTAMFPALVHDDILDIANTLQGAHRYILQSFVSAVTLDPIFREAVSFSPEILNSLCREIQKKGIVCGIR